VGRLEGCRLGWEVGCLLGSEVGCWEGCLDGCLVGQRVGCDVYYINTKQILYYIHFTEYSFNTHNASIN
jgi:hypothetical protein